MDSSASLDPIQQLPLNVRDKIWTFLNLTDLLQTRLVSSFWKRWSIPRFRRLAVIRLSPTTPHTTLSTYVATYPAYLHQNYVIDTTFLHTENMEDYIKVTMSMEFITLLFDEHGENVKHLIFRHRDCIQTPGQESRLTKDQVLQFLYNILRQCLLLEELELDVDVQRSSWFPLDIIFCELKYLRLDSLRSNAEENDGEEVLDLAQRIVDTMPNVLTFATRELWSKLQAKLFSNMAYNYLENNRCWPNLTGVKIQESIRFGSRLRFGEKIMDLGAGELDIGITSRPLTILHLGVVQMQYLSTAFKIMDTFRLSLVEVQMSVEIKNGLIPNTINHMPYLRRLSFVDCTIDVQKVPDYKPPKFCNSSKDKVEDFSSGSNSSPPDSDCEIISAKKKKKYRSRKSRNTIKRKHSVPSSTNSSESEARRVYKKEMFDFCFLSKIFWINSCLQEILPELHTLELTFASGFRTKFYQFFFPVLQSYPDIQAQETFPQIRNLILNYPSLLLDDKYLTWAQAIASHFPNVHNKHLNYARRHPQAAIQLNWCYSDSD